MFLKNILLATCSTLMADSGPSWPHLGLLLGRLGLPWRLHGAALGLSSGLLGRLGAVLALHGGTQATLGWVWRSKKATRGHDEQSWACLGPAWAVMRPSWGQQNLLWDTFGAFAKRPLGPLWAHFVASWGPLEPHWAISERFFIETIQYERILSDLYS